MASRRGRAIRALPICLLALALVAGLSGTSSAAPPVRPKVCNVLAFLQITGAPGAWNWNFVAGSGNCFGDGNGPYIVNGSGKGTSTALGLCDGLLVQNFDMDVNWTLLSLKDGATTFRHENWTAAISTFPVATPFLIRDPVSGSLQGAGTILSRFAGKCPPNDRPQAIMVEARLF